MGRLLIILSLLISFSSKAATSYYVANNAATNGDGSVNNPWPIYTAFNTNAIHSNDIIYLRNGLYRGNFNAYNLNGVTVRSYPGEWAQLTDGALGILLNSCDTTTNKIIMSGSELWQPAQVIFVGTELMQLSATSGSPTNWIVNRGWGTTNVGVGLTHNAGSIALVTSPIIQLVNCTNSIWRDLEIFGTTTTNRNVGTNWWNSEGIDCAINSPGTKLIDLIVHDTGHPGIGFWSQGDAEINGVIIYGCGMYDYSPSYAGGIGTPRGSPIYAQNESGFTVVKNIITFRNFTSGGKIYGETGPVIGWKWQDSISFQSAPGEPTFESSSGSTGTSNIWFTGNIMMGRPMMSYASLSNSALYFYSNDIVNGWFNLSEHTSSYLTNNNIMLPINAGALASPISSSNTTTNRNKLNIAWNNNTYYVASNGSPSQFTFHSADVTNAINSFGGGILDFVDGTNSWSAWSGFDSNSIWLTNWPVRMTTRVYPSDYDTNRWFINVIQNGTGSNTVNFNLSYLGIHSGESYDLRDVQNYFTSIANGIYDGSSSISLPLTLTNVSSVNGTITHYTNESTNVKYPALFNTFVLLRSINMTVIQATSGKGISVGGGNQIKL